MRRGSLVHLPRLDPKGAQQASSRANLLCIPHWGLARSMSPWSCQWGLEDSQTWFRLNLGRHEEAEGATRMAVPIPAGLALMEETRTQGYMHDSLHPEGHKHSSPLH